MKLLSTICDILMRKQSCVIATIVEKHGSSPRTAGAKIIILDNGMTIGTIGGGMLEAKIIERAKVLFNTGRPEIISLELTGDDIASMDMICGGHVDIFLERLDPTPETIEFYHRWQQTIDSGYTACMIITQTKKNSTIVQIDRCILLRDEIVYGSCPLPLDQVYELKNIAGQCKKNTHVQLISFDSYDVIIEKAIKPKTAFIFGAGHVAQPTCHLAAMVGFRVIVIDDRKEFANPKRFPDAFEIQAINDYHQVLKNLPIDSDSYIVIITRGHLHDYTVLAQALQTPASYIGMIGSHRKRDAIFAELRKQGYSQQDLNRVHSPIGLEIGAETPEEIAVSIVAEMIKCRASIKK